MNPDSKRALIEAARAARANAYAPYSVYFVGAAALAEGGTAFSGCNVENASYGLTICAERNAIANMVAHGKTRLAAVAVATADGAAPCGACLQVMSEFAIGSDVPVMLLDDDGNVRETTLGALLPVAFGSRK
jgi:cytidine deaminase